MKHKRKNNKQEKPKKQTEKIQQETLSTKKTEKKIKTQDNFIIDDVIESITHPFYIVDAKDYTIKIANSAAGVAKANKGVTCYTLTHKQDKPCRGEHVCPLKEVKKTKKPVITEHIHYDKNNNKRKVEVHGYPILDKKGNVVQMIEYSLDITERKKAEESLRLQAEIIANLSEAVYIVRASDGVIVYTNPKFEEMFGYAPGEMLGKNVSIVNAPTGKSPEETAREISEFINKTGGWQGEVRNVKKDGTPFWSYASVSVFDHPEHGSVWITSHTDITERKNAESKVEVANQQLRASEQQLRAVNQQLRANEQQLRAEIEERKKAEEEKAILLHRVGERAKELECLYGLSKLVEQPDILLEEIFQETTHLLPPAWQYPDITCAKVTFENKEFKTKKFKATRWKQSADIKVHKEIAGSIEVYYLEEKPESDEGPFLKEERKLIEAIAERLGKIAEHKKAEEALSQSETRFRGVFESQMIGILFWDAAGNITDANDLFLQMVGYTRDEVLSGTACWRDMTPPEYKEQDDKALEEITATGVMTPIEKEYICKDGSRIPILLGASGLPGATFSGVAFVLDITEHKKAEEKLNQVLKEALKSREILMSMLEDNNETREELEKNTTSLLEAQRIAHVGNWELDIVSIKLTWSDEIYRMFGLEPQQFEATYEAFLDNIHPDDREMVNKAYNESVKNKTPYNIVHRLLMKDGSIKYVNEKCETFYDNKGKPIRSVGTIQDITERKKAEEELREKEVSYRTLVENLPQKIFLKDRKSVYVSCNENYAKDLKIKSDEIAGKTDYDFYPRELAEKYRADDKRFMVSGKTEDIEEEYIVNGQKRFVHTSKTPIRDDKGNINGILGVFWDITEQRKIEKEKTELQQQLLQAQKMEAIGTLSGGIAHDFNNILGVIRGCADLVIDDIDKKNPIYEDIEEIREQTKFAANLTGQLLLFSRQQTVNIENININEIIDDLTKMLGRIIGEDINMDINLGPELYTIKGDKGNIGQVMMNLAVNARDAMPKGGELTIKTENLVLSEKDSKNILNSKPGQFVLLSIQDTGVGMNKEITDRIFEPFFTTKELGKGTGLGLSVVFGIVKQHGGWINVYSEPGKGTIFKIYLQALPETTEVIKEKNDSALREIEGSGESILLVEDDKSVRNLNKKVLNKYGYKTLEAASAEEAMEIFKEKKGDFHLVLSDTILPGKNGIELIEEILSQNPDMKVLLSSGYTGERVSVDEITGKGINFIQKPYGTHELLKTIKEIINK